MKNHIAILMGTKNGAAFLPAQLQSIKAQSHRNWSLWISDDGSTDATLEIIQAFQAQNPELTISLMNGPKEGFCRNFLGLMADETITADSFALADQDDIWLPNHLSRGLEMLEKSGASLYGARTIYIDENDAEIGQSPLFRKKPSLQNALVQSIAGANTMLLTKDAMNHVRQASDVDVVSHDWWLYLYLTASGFPVFYDDQPTVLYRKHDNNVIGPNIGFRAKIWRLVRLMRSEFKTWNDQHLSALKSVRSLANAPGRDIIQEWEGLRQLRGFRAARKLRTLSLHRQTLSGDIALRVAVFIGKL